MAIDQDSQWIFQFSALQNTPSWEISNIPLDQELKERAKGVEFIFRVAAHLKLLTPVQSAAAQFLHRFYMRYSVADYPRHDVAAACLFLASKTEEHSRKLKDLAYICYSKAAQSNDENSPEVARWQKVILATEEVLLEALCFDFIVDHPHADLIQLLQQEPNRSMVFEHYVWTVMTDALRTPICLLQPSRIIASACFILAEKLLDGPNSASLDERIFSRPSASLPTPPHMHPRSPKSTNAPQAFFQLSDNDLEAVALTITVLLDFYSAYASPDDNFSHLLPITEVARPSLTLPGGYPGLYTPDPRTQQNSDQGNSTINDGAFTPASLGRTPYHLGGTQESSGPSSPAMAPGSTTPSVEYPNPQKALPRQPPLDLS